MEGIAQGFWGQTDDKETPTQIPKYCLQVTWLGKHTLKNLSCFMSFLKVRQECRVLDFWKRTGIKITVTREDYNKMFCGYSVYLRDNILTQFCLCFIFCETALGMLNDVFVSAIVEDLSV